MTGVIPLTPQRPPSQPPARPTLDLLEFLPAHYRGVDLATRGAWSEELPGCVFIEVTNHCNLLCQTCPRTFYTYEQPQTLSWDNFLRVVEQFPTMQRAVLHGIGEPLINRDLPRMIRYLKDRDVTVLFNTNAVLLNAAWDAALIDSGLDELRCSLDAARPETYARIRGVPVLPKIVANLERFTATQRARGVATPRVSIWVTAMQENIAEVPELVRLAARIGAPEVYLQRMVFPEAAEAHLGLLQPEQSLYVSYGEQEAATVAEAERLASELGVSFRASGATTPKQSFGSSQQPPDPRPWAACTRPWTTAYITANGNALPCCISPFATTDYASLLLGNLFDEPFADVWNGERYQRWRTALLSDAPQHACAGCGVNWSL
jgi:MoaA/NifB/PqqE/SkfB family radical SAM enzyme